MAGAFQLVGQAEAAHAVAKAMANEYADYFIKTRHVARRTQSL
jgi:hypothetical protein